MVTPLVEQLGYCLWGLECRGAGRASMVRLFIDTDPPGGSVTIADVEQVSRQVSMLFDLEDPIQGSYQLEVSSPGVDRRFFTIEQCKDYVGEQIQLRLKEPREGRRTFCARLAEVGIEPGTLCVEENGERHDFRFDEVREMNLVWQS